MTLEQTRSSRDRLSLHTAAFETKCGCGTCGCEQDDMQTVAALAVYTKRKTARLERTVRRSPFELGDYKQIKPGTPEASKRCDELRATWKSAREHVADYREDLAAAAKGMEQARRAYSSQMDVEIARAFAQLLLDMGGAIVTLASGDLYRRLKAVGELVGAGTSFEAWRRKYNRELPAKIDQELKPWKIRYDSAVSGVKYWLKAEADVAKTMKRLRCANFH